ncbi:MAG: serine protease [Pseudomonadota bacterium]
MQGKVRALFAVIGVVVLGWITPAIAQDQAWVQIEARPTLGQALERARAYDNQVDNVTGYRLSSGWFAITLGPYTPFQAEGELARLRALNAIPPDSFVADGQGFGEQFWPDGPVSSVAVPATPAPLPLVADETPAQARATERGLPPEDRFEIQQALEWTGFYTSTIDGLFGPGTRRSMAAWQAAEGFEPTGVLTTGQRATLLGAFREARESLGLRLVTDMDAGIEVELPTALVAFDRYEAPFAHYEATDGSGVSIQLISQAGDSGSMAALYEILQTLEVLPPEGRRGLNRRGFTIEGENRRSYGFATVTLSDETLKGYIVSWPADDRERRVLAMGAMAASFTSIPGAVLPDDMGLTQDQRPDLVSGLQIRSPKLSQSGAFIGAGGGVLTAAAGLASCGRITVGDEMEATVAAMDDTLGVALLRPVGPLSPIGTVQLSGGTARLKSEVAVAGYSYGGLLGAPTVTYGTLEDVRGLDGDTRVDRLSIAVQPGDAGGPVLNQAGEMLGILLPAPGAGARSLPSDVHLSADARALAPFLAENGVPAEAAAFGAGPLAPEDLAVLAADATALVQCWE